MLLQCETNRPVPKSCFGFIFKKVNYLQTNFASDQAIVEYGAAILRYMLPAKKTLQQYVKDFITKPYEVMDVIDKGFLKNAIIEGVDGYIRQSHRCYWATNHQADLTNITFQAERLLFKQKNLWTFRI